MATESEVRAKLAHLARELRALSAMPLRDKDDLVAWYAAAQKLQDWIGSSAEFSGSVPHLLWHYLSDADTRMEDDYYAAEQDAWLRQFLEAIDRGEMPKDDARPISGAPVWLAFIVALGFAAYLLW